MEMQAAWRGDRRQGGEQKTKQGHDSVFGHSAKWIRAAAGKQHDVLRAALPGCLLRCKLCAAAKRTDKASSTWLLDDPAAGGGEERTKSNGNQGRRA